VTSPPPVECSRRLALHLCLNIHEVSLSWAPELHAGPRSSNRQAVQALAEMDGIVIEDLLRSRRPRLCASDNGLYNRAWRKLLLGHQLLSSLKSSKPSQDSSPAGPVVRLEQFVLDLCYAVSRHGHVVCRRSPLGRVVGLGELKSVSSSHGGGV
jgi:hypothetical protein